MNAWEELLAGPPGDYPRGPAPRRVVRRRPWIVALLLAACLIPRTVAAWNWDVLWGDTLHYRYASICLEQGNFQQGLAEFGLNVFPLILIPLRHLGVDWEIAGKYFCVLVATLTVLPLWGWLRRMFDDRLAMISCLAYAVHGKLIGISPLIIRDSTFWFLLVLTLYLLWRAASDLRLAHYMAAGIALTLAVHTRTEGWLLLVPLLGWGACRWCNVAQVWHVPESAKGVTLSGFHALRGLRDVPHTTENSKGSSGIKQSFSQRFRLAIGTLLCVAVIPAAVTMVNLTWLRDNPRWEFLRTSHLIYAIDWWNSMTGMHLPTPQPDRVAPPSNPLAPTAVPHDTKSSSAAIKSPFPPVLIPDVAPPERSMPSWRLNFKMFQLVVKAYTTVGGILLLAGLFYGRRIFLRPEHLALFCMSLLWLIISRIRYWTAGLDLRYFMPLVIISLPWISIGLENVIAGAAWCWQKKLCCRRRECSTRALHLLVVSLVAIATTCSLLESPMSAAVNMRKHAALGQWIRDRAGADVALAGNVDELALEVYYAGGHVVDTFWPQHCLMVPMPMAITTRTADVIILWNEDKIFDQHLAQIAQRVDYCGYQRVDAKEISTRDWASSETELMVFLKREAVGGENR